MLTFCFQGSSTQVCDLRYQRLQWRIGHFLPDLCRISFSHLFAPHGHSLECSRNKMNSLAIRQQQEPTSHAVWRFGSRRFLASHRWCPVREDAICYLFKFRAHHHKSLQRVSSTPQNAGEEFPTNKFWAREHHWECTCRFLVQQRCPGTIVKAMFSLTCAPSCMFVVCLSFSKDLLFPQWKLVAFHFCGHSVSAKEPFTALRTSVRVLLTLTMSLLKRSSSLSPVQKNCRFDLLDWGNQCHLCNSHRGKDNCCNKR